MSDGYPSDVRTRDIGDELPDVEGFEWDALAWLEDHKTEAADMYRQDFVNEVIYHDILDMLNAAVLSDDDAAAAVKKLRKKLMPYMLRRIRDDLEDAQNGDGPLAEFVDQLD